MAPDPLLARLKNLQDRLLELAAEASELCAQAEARKPLGWPEIPSHQPAFESGEIEPDFMHRK